MNYKEYEDKVNSMLDKIGNESSNLILDDVGILLSDNQKMNKDLENKEAEITKLKSLNSRLQEINGNLLQQVPMKEEIKKEDKDEKRKPLNYFDLFDENGNFKQRL